MGLSEGQVLLAIFSKFAMTGAGVSEDGKEMPYRWFVGYRENPWDDPVAIGDFGSELEARMFIFERIAEEFLNVPRAD